MIGQRLLHYEVSAQLGEGGMGVVYQATDTRLGREVAIKVLPEAFVEDAERLARFQREAQLLASLNHPNIGGIYGLEEDGATRFLVLELIPGETLAERLARGAMPVGEALSVGTQIARALEAAHERGIVHRDLKPANIKLTPNGTVKVLDFGLAKAWDQPAGADMTHSPTLTAQMTQAGVILGTASYMSPEQARGKPADKRADIWSFGVVLWEILTGRKLFSGETVSDVLAAVLRAEPPHEDLPARLPRGVRRVLDRCLAKNPEERLHDVADARIELDEALTELSNPGARGERSDAPRRGWLRSAALALAIAIVAATGSLYLDRRLGRSMEGAADPGARLRLDVHLGNLWIQKGGWAPSLLALSPDGGRIAFVGNGELHVRSVEELDAERLPGTFGSNCPFFSPDGSRIGFEADDRLKILSAEGGGVRTLCAAPNMRGATWSPSGSIYFATGSGELSRISEEGGEPEVLLVSDDPNADAAVMHGEIFYARWPMLLPGEHHLLFTSLSPELGDQTRWSLHVLSLETGEHRLLLENAGAARFLPPDRLVFVRGGNDYDLAGNLYLVEIDPRTAELSGTPREVLHGVHVGDDAATPYFDLSRYGDLLYSPTDPSMPARRLVWVDRTGDVTSAYPHRGAWIYPRLSPDGNRVVVAERNDIWVLDLERGTETRITSSGNADIPIWTPDGERVIFQVADPEEGLRLYWAPAAGGSMRPVSSHRAEFPNFVSPDGRRVNFSQQTSSAQWDLYELSLEEEGPAEPWLATDVLENYARLSPNGRWIAYRTGSEIAVRPYPAPGPATIVSPAGGRQPIWSPDGRELYYLARGELMVAPVGPGEALSVGPPRPLLDLPDEIYMRGRSYDVHPDGERFLMLLGDDKEIDPLRLVYVAGWSREIR